MCHAGANTHAKMKADAIARQTDIQHLATLRAVDTDPSIVATAGLAVLQAWLTLMCNILAQQ